MKPKNNKQLWKWERYKKIITKLGIFFRIKLATLTNKKVQPKWLDFFICLKNLTQILDLIQDLLIHEPIH